MREFSRRILKVQALLAGRSGEAGGVVRWGPDESPEQAVAAAVASGRRGGFLVVPEVMAIDDWERAAAKLPAYQAACMAEAQAQGLALEPMGAVRQ